MLVGPRLGLRGVALSYAAPPDADAEAAFFDCPVRYGAEAVAIQAPAEFDQIELVRCEPGVREALEVAARTWLQSLQERAPSADDPIAQCKRHIVDGLCADTHGIEQVAARMHVSVRTLQRRLDEHGSSFRELVEVARREATERLMENPKLSLLDIALLVGFSEQSAFNRAARRWFSMTPSEYRTRRRTHS
jgi:AraC-like DNA-binding protein